MINTDNMTWLCEHVQAEYSHSTFIKVSFSDQDKPFPLEGTVENSNTTLFYTFRKGYGVKHVEGPLSLLMSFNDEQEISSTSFAGD